MANHIGRKQAIGLGKESVAGNAVAATAWIPKTVSDFVPKFEKAIDDSAYGVIDEVFDSQTTKNMTEINVEGILRDNWFGNLLLAALGQVTAVKIVTITGASGGSPARGDAISSVTGSWSGVIKKVVIIGGTTYYAVSTTTGTVSNQSDVTNGTWTGGTLTIKTGVYGHFFQRLNTNAHPTFTIYGSDPVADERAAYCMLDSLEMEVAVGDFAKFKAMFKGKQLESTGAQSPVYTSDNPFLAKHASVYFAASESALNAATASEVQRFKIGIQKNVVDVQAFGDTDIASLHNQQFTISGDLDAIYSAVTYRDYVANSTKKAARLAVVNTDATALSTGIYPSIYIDMARLSFEEWTRSTDNNALVNQTMGFSGEFSVSDAMTIEVLLLNGNATGY